MSPEQLRAKSSGAHDTSKRVASFIGICPRSVRNFTARGLPAGDSVGAPARYFDATRLSLRLRALEEKSRIGLSLEETLSGQAAATQKYASPSFFRANSGNCRRAPDRFARWPSMAAVSRHLIQVVVDRTETCDALHSKAILGHRANDQVLFDSYRSLARKKDGEAYFCVAARLT